ncbi:MAG: F0F1 ATP synthase subunit delta [Jatrophihabitantaceae bacterium]
MRAASRETLARLREQREAVLGTDASAAALNELAADLYATSDLLNAQPRLRRTLSDASTSADARAELVQQLLDGKVSTGTVEVVQAAVRGRWSSPWDLPDALELVADDTLFAVAERQGNLETVENELFGFERLLDTEPRLATLLDEETVHSARRVELLGNVVTTKLDPITRTLLEHAVASKRKHVLASAVDILLDQAASRRDLSVARVLTAVELTDEQQAQLTATLSDTYGRAISVRAAVDPDVRGGLVVRVGDEIIDGSVATRLSSARAAFAR